MAGTGGLGNFLRNVSRRFHAVSKTKRVPSSNGTIALRAGSGHKCGGQVLLGVAVVNALSWGSSKQNVGAAKSEKEELIELADSAYNEGKLDELYNLLIQHKDSDNPDILWRLARAARDKGKADGEPVKQKLYFEGFDYAKKALEVDPNCFAAHKWYAIMLSYIGEYEGTKAQILNAYQVKEHFIEALKLNPMDATTIHCLGFWCFEFANLPWYMRKIASVAFTTPPSSTYQEALEYFLKAEEVDPNFYSMNLTMIGKTYLCMNDKENALLYLTRARDYPVKTKDDEEAHRMACELLKSI